MPTLRTLDQLLKQNLKGKTFEVYFEELSKDYHVSGRTHNNIIVKVKGSEELLGKFKKVRITEVARTVMTGEIIEEENS